MRASQKPESKCRKCVERPVSTLVAGRGTASDIRWEKSRHVSRNHAVESR